MSLYQKFVKHFLYPLDRYRTGNYAEIGYLREVAEKHRRLPVHAEKCQAGSFG